MNSPNGTRRTSILGPTGKTIANRNLWISIPSLLCGFAVWVYWGIITVQMLNLGFPFAQSQLFTLTAIAGLTGATLRIPSTFFVRIAGGRNTIFFTTALLMIPAIGAGTTCKTRTRRCGSSRCWPSCRASAAATSLVHVQHQLLLPQEDPGLSRWA